MLVLSANAISVEGLLAVIPESVGLFVVAIILIAAAVGIRAIVGRPADDKAGIHGTKDLR